MQTEMLQARQTLSNDVLHVAFVLDAQRCPTRFTNFTGSYCMDRCKVWYCKVGLILREGDWKRFDLGARRVLQLYTSEKGAVDPWGW